MNNLKRKMVYLIPLLLFFTITPFYCSKAANNLFDPYNTTPTTTISQEDKDDILMGRATSRQLRDLKDSYYNWQESIKGIDDPVDQAEISSDANSDIISMPATGKLLFTLKDNNAGWKSEVYITIGGEDILVISDSREGPLDITTEYNIAENASVGFFIVTYPNENTAITQSAASSQCQWEKNSDLEWVFEFEDMPASGSYGEPDWDYNDCVFNVEVVPDDSGFIDLSHKLDVSIEYLDHHGYNEDGYVIYYIGETMNYQVKLSANADDYLLREKKYTVYVVHEYFESITCDRWWYPTPPRPEDEPQEITVCKGDPLPNQNPPLKFTDVSISETETVFSAEYNSTLAVAAGNDQTHVYIVCEDDDGNIELKIYDNPECGVYDPPAQ